jgi:hypothetical protein
MSYTNVHIKDDLSVRKSSRLKDAELAFWQATADELQAKLENIPKAIKEHGYVDIYYDGEHLRLELGRPPDPMP